MEGATDSRKFGESDFNNLVGISSKETEPKTEKFRNGTCAEQQLDKPPVSTSLWLKAELLSLIHI